MKRLIILSSLFLLCVSPLRPQTPESGSVADIDGNIYRTVIIGRYEWMAENLRTTSYGDGTKITGISDSIAWQRLVIGAFCWYHNDEGHAKTWGALYNWYAVNTGRLCPDGWRVPSDEAWKLLEGNTDSRYSTGDPVWDLSGGRGTDAGLMLKNRSGWDSGGNGKDGVGFSALPGGERCSNGRFFVGGKSGFWWSSTASGESTAWYRNMIYGLDDIYRNTHPKWMGFSVRCIRDKQRP